VWFAPNVGSPDLLELFTDPEAWRVARRSTDVFKFYAQQLLADRPRDCPECGENLFPELARVEAFTRLNAWGLGIGIEVGAIKPWGCVASATVPQARRAMRRVEDRRAVVTDLALDEPLLGAQGCQLTLEEAAIHTAAFARESRAARPYLRVGIIEPYPVFSADTLLAWVEALRGHGFTPSFLHLDVDRRHAGQLGADVGGDLLKLRTAMEAQGIPFGVIFWSDVGTSDEAYYGDAMGWLTAVGAAIGEPTHSIFQSWVESADGRRAVPSNVPEADATAFTHTRLLNEGLADLRGRSRPRTR
ncbi:MAG TPA: hypothetical protein VMR21_14940, partial [Vicinamibacteria bacterium]|nr:hypothetical protein [Vicinamibacteria bacterium]